MHTPAAVSGTLTSDNSGVTVGTYRIVGRNLRFIQHHTAWLERR